MDNLIPQQDPQLSLPQKKRRNVACIVVMVIFCAIGVVALVKGKSVKTNANAAAAGPFHAGEVVVVNYGGDKFDATGAAIIAVDKESLSAFTDAGRTGSAILDTLMSRNKIFTVLNGTKARVLDSQSSATKIRIIDGDSQGRDGWVSNVFLYE